MRNGSAEIQQEKEVNVEIRNNKNILINSATRTKITTPKQQTYLVNNNSENTTENNTTSTLKFSKMRKKLDFN